MRALWERQSDGEFKPKTFVIGQSDGDGVFMGGDEFERAVVIIMDSFVSEGFICTAHGDVVTVLVLADIYFVTRHAIEVRERAFNGLAVDICPVHESYFQFESKKLLAGFFIPCCSSRNSKNRASSMARAIPTIATTNRIAAKCSCVIAMLGKRPKSPNRSLADVIRLRALVLCQMDDESHPLFGAQVDPERFPLHARSARAGKLGG